MRQRYDVLLPLAAMAAAALACNLPFFAASTPPAAATLGRLYTAAAQTLTAASTQSASATPTTTATGAFPAVTPATGSASAVPISRCDAASFVRDVTIPDGTAIDAGDDFTKTWRLMNAGTCSWTTAYSLVFVSGDRMHAPANIDMPGRVNPGQTVDLSVKMSAPPTTASIRVTGDFAMAQERCSDRCSGAGCVLGQDPGGGPHIRGIRFCPAILRRHVGEQQPRAPVPRQ